MKLYIYNDENEVVAIATGETNQDCEQKAQDYFDAGYLGTYSPAFGFDGGLIDNDDAIIL